jgi:outer membrane protein OmpU
MPGAVAGKDRTPAGGTSMKKLLPKPLMRAAFRRAAIAAKHGSLPSTIAVTVLGLASTGAHGQTKVEPIRITIGGFYGQFFSYINQDDVGDRTNGRSGKLTQFDVSSDSEIHFNGRTTLDNGLIIGFRVELEGNTDSDQIDESFLFAEGRLGRIELGSINNVAYRMHYEAPEAFTRGWLVGDGNLTNNVANPTGSPSFDSTLIGTKNRFFDNDSEKINYYTPRFGGFQLGVSYVPNSAQDRNGSPDPISTAYSRGVALGANFVRTFGAFDVAASAGFLQWQGPQLTTTDSAPDPKAWQTGLQLGYAGFKVGGSYAKITDGRSGSSGTNAATSTAGTGANKVEGHAWNVGAQYTFGPATVSLTYAQGRNDDSPVAGPSFGDDKFSGISAAGKYVLGPGISLEGVVFRTEFDGNGSTAAPDSNTATGALVGLLLVF